MGWAVEHSQPILANDALSDPRALQIPGTPARPGGGGGRAAHRRRRGARRPQRLAGRRPRGVLQRERLRAHPALRRRRRRSRCATPTRTMPSASAPRPMPSPASATTAPSSATSRGIVEEVGQRRWRGPATARGADDGPRQLQGLQRPARASGRRRAPPSRRDRDLRRGPQRGPRLPLRRRRVRRSSCPTPTSPRPSRVAGRIRRAVAAPDRRPTRRPVTITVGVAGLPGDATDRAGLIAAADTALYYGKRAGEDRVVRADRLTADVGDLRGTLEELAAAALRDGDDEHAVEHLVERATQLRRHARTRRPGLAARRAAHDRPLVRRPREPRRAATPTASVAWPQPVAGAARPRRRRAAQHRARRPPARRSTTHGLAELSADPVAARGRRADRGLPALVAAGCVAGAGTRAAARSALTSSAPRTPTTSSSPGGDGDRASGAPRRWRCCAPTPATFRRRRARSARRGRRGAPRCRPPAAPIDVADRGGARGGLRYHSRRR